MHIRTLSRSLIERLVARFGYELRIAGSPPCGYSTFLRRLVDIGVQPRTVFDVGVGYGTPWLYEAFPRAHFVLIEPQERFEMELRAICRTIDAEYHLVGAGSKEQQLPIFQLPGSPTGSSFLPPNAETDRHYGTSEKSADAIGVVPLDTYAALPGPCFVKIDTEGFELEVLHGATRILEKTDVVLLETAITERQVGEPDLIDVGAFMKRNGFRLIDFPVITPQGKDGPLLYLDAAFARINGPAARAAIA